MDLASMVSVCFYKSKIKAIDIDSLIQHNINM